MSTVIATAYVAIRKSVDDSREWIDLSSMGFIAECVEQDARRCELKIPAWAKANPVQRIVKVTITEED